MTRTELIQKLVEEEAEEWSIKDLLRLAKIHHMDFLSRQPEAELKILAEYYGIEYDPTEDIDS